jgi:hypothetical protein
MSNGRSFFLLKRACNRSSSSRGRWRSIARARGHATRNRVELDVRITPFGRSLADSLSSWGAIPQKGGKPAFRGCLENDRSPRYSRRSVESALNATNDIEIHVFANEARRQALLIAKFDNLAKARRGLRRRISC